MVGDGRAGGKPAVPGAVGEDMLEALRDEFIVRAWRENPAALKGDREAARRLIRDVVAAKNAPLSAVEVLMQDVFGWGPLSALMADPEVTDIWVIRHDLIAYEKNGQVLDWPHAFSSEEHLRRTVERMAMATGRKVDESRPVEDFRLPDGSRAVVFLPPVAVRGATLTIRKFSRLFTLEELAERELFPKNLIRFFRLAVKARLNVLTAGGMGSGKNTLLNALMLCVGKDENLVFVEDPAESKVGLPDPDRPDLPVPRVRVFEPRRAGVEGTGEVPLALIFEKCMRTKPTRILCSECRCPVTAYYTLQAMNIGHPGSMSSIHVEGPEEVPTRLSDLLAAFPGGAYSDPAARAGKVAAVELVLFLGILKKDDGYPGHRRLLDIAEVRRPPGGGLPEIVPLYTFDVGGFDAEGRPLGELRPTGEVPAFLSKRKLSIYLSKEELAEMRSFFEAPARRAAAVEY